MLCMTCNMFYYIGRRALADITNQDGEVIDTREGQPLIAAATAGLSILVNACQCLESNRKVLTEETKMHITIITVKYSYTDHPRIV